MIDNIPRIFTTQPPGERPSRYYVYRAGIIRVKLANRTVHFSPGKNICFFDDWGKRGDQIVFQPTHIEYFHEPFAYTALLDPNSGNQYAGLGRRPIDFYLNPVGFLAPNPRCHRGHPIVDTFEARIGGRDVNPDKLDLYIQERFGLTDGVLRTMWARTAMMSNYMAYIITS